MVTTPLTATNAERLLGGLQGRKEQPLVTGKRAWEVFSYGVLPCIGYPLYIKSFH